MRVVVLAGWCCCLLLQLLPTRAIASFTSSFQPCELPTSTIARDAVLARCHVEFAGQAGTVELVGTRPDLVHTVVFRRLDGTVLQRLAISARPLIDPENVSISLRDMNFDRMADFGLRDFAVDGPNEPWKFWLWDVHQNKFVYHEMLSHLPNPEAGAKSKVVRSYVVDDRNNVTTNIYAWRDGKLVLLESIRDTTR